MFKCKKSEFDFDTATALDSSKNNGQLITRGGNVFVDTIPWGLSIDGATDLSTLDLVSATELSPLDFVSANNGSYLVYCKTSDLNEMQLALIKYSTGIDSFDKYVMFIKELNLAGTSNRRPKFGNIEDAFSMTGAISTKKVEHVRDHVLVMELLSFIASNQSDIDSCISETLDIIE